MRGSSQSFVNTTLFVVADATFAESCTAMFRIVTVVIVFFLSGCASISRDTTCFLAPQEEGWQLVDQPEGIEYEQRLLSSRYVLWFKNPEGILLSCERPRVNGGCSEIGTSYSLQNNQWVAHEIQEVVVCT